MKTVKKILETLKTKRKNLLTIIQELEEKRDELRDRETGILRRLKEIDIELDLLREDGSLYHLLIDQLEIEKKNLKLSIT